jgi:hypothetical protein
VQSKPIHSYTFLLGMVTCILTLVVNMQAGKYVTPDVTRALVVVISNASELQGYTVRALYRVFQAWDGQESLGQVTIWCIGEYGEMLVDHLNEVEGEEPLTVSSGFCFLSFFSCLRCHLSAEFLNDSLGVVLMGSNCTVFLANFNLFIFEFVGLFGPYMLLLKGNLNICLNDHQCYLDQSSILSCGLIFPFLQSGVFPSIPAC